MIHIVFNEADIDVLKEAIKLDDSLSGEVVQVKDDLAVGPLKDIFTEEGIGARKQWWREVLSGGDIEGKVDDGSVDDLETVKDLKEKLDGNPGEILWIWAAQNKHDVSGYYWLMSQLAEYHGRVFILYLNNLPFLNEKGNIFYPENLHTIPPKEFLKAKKLARPVTLSEFEVDPDEWKRITEEDKYVRLLEGGKKLVQRDVDFYDDELKKYITGDWQKASKVIHAFLHKAKHTTGDMFLLWRLKLLIQSGDYDVQGTVKNMKDFEVKKKAATPQLSEN
ncbi:MAG: DUF1835 domain-containing protein [Chitinophagaceae bacterium]|nr:DUF1835 domain-containing protein [Chitinophagaceae bacterium]